MASCKRKDCIYKSITKTLGEVTCNYYSITGKLRLCDVEKCDKYEKGVKKRGRKRQNEDLFVGGRRKNVQKIEKEEPIRPDQEPFDTGDGDFDGPWSESLLPEIDRWTGSL